MTTRFQRLKMKRRFQKLRKRGGRTGLRSGQDEGRDEDEEMPAKLS
jgi:hypothetical protein